MASLTPQEKSTLLDVVTKVIQCGLEKHCFLQLTPSEYSSQLQKSGASFVTLKHHTQLRGCMGTLIPHQPLVQDVSSNAYSAAFHDPRFYPLTLGEYPDITQQISILSPTTPVVFASEEDLLHELRPGIDGVILSERGLRSAFLPAVWEELPKPRMFLQHLKMKAGLAEDYWSDTLKIERYTVEVVA